MSVKKESLFKQKLKQAKLVEKGRQVHKEKQMQNLTQIEIQSFPKVFKIDQYNIGHQIQTNKAYEQLAKNNSMQDETQQQLKNQFQQSYLKSHQQSLSGILSQNEINQINTQNWNAVDSMSEEERQNYINLIQNTLPQHFIKKLKKSNQILPVTQTKKQNTQKIMPEIAKIAPDMTKLLIQNNKSKDKIEQKPIHEEQHQDESQDHKTIMAQIYLNIKSGKLMYIQENVLDTFTEEQKTEMLNRAKIYEMLTSQNNQSQIVGSQLVLIWLKNIFPSQMLLFYVSNIPFHLRIMLSQMYDLLMVIESNLKKTKFYSCYIEMLVKVVEILTIVYKNLSDSELKEQIMFIENQFQKTQKLLKELLSSKNIENSQSNQLQQKQMLFQSLGILYQSLKDQQSKRDQNQKSRHESLEIQQKFQKLKSAKIINEFIEVILIQQTLRKQQFQKYEIHPSINNFLQILTSFWDDKIGPNSQNFYKKLKEVFQFSNIFYSFVCKFNKKQKKLLFYKNLLKKIFHDILEVIENLYLKKIIQSLISKNKVQQQNKNKNSQIHLKNAIFFQILFIYRQLANDTQKFVSYLQKERQNWSISEEQASILIYLNFDHYVSVSDLKTQEIKMIENMLQWLNKEIQKSNKNQRNYLDSSQVLISLLKLFLSTEQQVYSLLDQNLLQQVFNSAISFYESSHERIQPILSENEIKKMVQNYNFNSFGNDIFTKVIFWVAVSISSQIQAFIGEEVMMRYPMLFYYASEPLQSVEQNLKNPLIFQKIECPLLGEINSYFSTNHTEIKKNFSSCSNESIKENLLQLLSLNINFQNMVNSKNQKLQKILTSKQNNQTQGFNITKNKANLSNYFIRYLIDPFLS